MLAPAIQLADGYPIEAQTANSIEREKERLRQWRYSRAVMLPHAGEPREAPRPGEMFLQKELAATLRKLVEAEQQALRQGKSRKDAIKAAYDRFYSGDIARELVRGDAGGGRAVHDGGPGQLAARIEEPVCTDYRGIEVCKLQQWPQGPAMLQALNILENADLKAMGYNSPRYMHTVYQAMNLAFADRDFYYGDPAFPPEEPMRGLLSKEYARARRADRLDAQRPGRQAGRPVSLPGRHQSVRRAARAAGTPRGCARRRATARVPHAGARPAAVRPGWRR